MVGREFTDGVIPGLFALPVGRATIASAKLLTYAIWSIGVAILLPLVMLGAGVVAGLGVPGPAAVSGLVRLGVLSLAGALLAAPAALAATLGRSVLAAVGVAIGLLVVAQVSVIAGAGGWMPLAAPALWALSAGAAVSPVQLAMVIPFACIWIAATIIGWHRLQLDR
jgi:ABC-2 type transport system permease protein